MGSDQSIEDISDNYSENSENSEPVSTDSTTTRSSNEDKKKYQRLYYRKKALRKLQKNFVVLKKINEIFDINTKSILGDNEIIICDDYSDIEEYNDEIRNFRNMNKLLLNNIFSNYEKIIKFSLVDNEEITAN